jgi:hypothetical protein
MAEVLALRARRAAGEATTCDAASCGTQPGAAPAGATARSAPDGGAR